MAVLLPQEIQNDFDLLAQNERLKQLRAAFNEAVSKMETGSFSVKYSMTASVSTDDSLKRGFSCVIFSKIVSCCDKSKSNCSGISKFCHLSKLDRYFCD